MSIPTPKERPDLYDDMDCRPGGRETGISTPPDIQKLLDEREKKFKAQQKKGNKEPA